LCRDNKGIFNYPLLFLPILISILVGSAAHMLLATSFTRV
jgi:hypothetical protein